MRGVVVAIVMGALLWTAARAQDEAIEDFSFEDLPEAEVGSFYEVLGVGVIGTAQFLDVTAVQDLVAQLFPKTQPTFDAPLYCTGVYVMESFFPGAKFRFGFLYASGSKTIEGTELLALDSVAVKRRLSYAVSYNALTVDYAVVPVPRLALVGGVQLGWGSVQLEAAQSTMQRDFQQEFQFERNATNRMTSLSALHFFAAPQLAVEWSPAPTALLRVAGTYHFSWVGKWKVDNIQAIENVPETLHSGGPGLQIGLFIGLFRVDVP